MAVSARDREEASKQYDAALKLGRRYLSDRGPEEGYLQALTPKLKGVEIAGEMSIGLHEIALKKVIGTYAAGRSTAFAGNFMPLLDRASEFGEKWVSLFASHLSSGIRDPIKVYEYLGYYYVVEGNKRVSVLKSVGAYAVHAEVTRILPARNDDRQVVLAYEFLDFDKMRLFDSMWFSKPGRFPWLVEQAREYAKDREELREDTQLDWMFESFGDFARRYREIPEARELEITTADAFYRYVQIFGFPIHVEMETLARRVRQTMPEFELLPETEDALLKRVKTTLKESDEKPLAALFGLKKKYAPVMGFMLPQNPARRGWALTHATAIRELRRKFGDKMSFLAAYPGEGETTLETLEALAENQLGILFATAMNLREDALKFCLEHPSLPVLCCSPKVERNSMSTYNARFFEGTFLAGILAGIMTMSDQIGVVAKNADSWLLPCDLSAFAQGARLVNPRVHVSIAYLDGKERVRTSQEVREALSRRGVDVVLTGSLSDGPVIDRLPGDVAMTLCYLGRGGQIVEFYGAITLSWARFYKNMAQQLLEGTMDTYAPGDPVHYRWGIKEGMVDFLLVNSVLGVEPVRLVRFFREMVMRRDVQIFRDYGRDVAFADVVDDGTLPPWMEALEEE